MDLTNKTPPARSNTAKAIGLRPTGPALSGGMDQHPPKPAARRLGVHFSSARGDWPTPSDLFRTLDDEFDFTIDVAASDDNAKAARYFTEADDGLSQSWAGETVYCNPPYGRGVIDRWVDKAVRSAGDGATVVLLVPARPGSRWFTRLLERADEVRFMRRRVTFEGASDPAPFPSAVAVLHPRLAGPVAEVVEHPWVTVRRA